MNQFGIRFLCPALRGCIELIGIRAHGSRKRHTFRREKRKLAFPIQPCRRDPRIRQPVKRDVVEDVVSRKTLSLAVKDTRDQLVTAYVVVEYLSGEADRRVRDPVHRLRASTHLLGVGQVACIEEGEPLVGI